MKAYEIKAATQGMSTLALIDRAEPELESRLVSVKMHAASLNFRDTHILRGTYGVQPKVPLSDGAGKVIAIGPGVTRVKVGDRVAAAFRQTHISGELIPEKAASALGGEQEGVLAEIVVFNEQGLVMLPEYLS